MEIPDPDVPMGIFTLFNNHKSVVPVNYQQHTMRVSWWVKNACTWKNPEDFWTRSSTLTLWTRGSNTVYITLYMWWGTTWDWTYPLEVPWTRDIIVLTTTSRIVTRLLLLMWFSYWISLTASTNGYRSYWTHSTWFLLMIRRLRR